MGMRGPHGLTSFTRGFGAGISLVAVGFLLLLSTTANGQETATAPETTPKATSTDPPTTAPGESHLPSLASESTRAPNTSPSQTAPESATATESSTSTPSAVPSSQVSTAGTTSTTSAASGTSTGARPSAESSGSTTTAAALVDSTNADETANNGTSVGSPSTHSTLTTPNTANAPNTTSTTTADTISTGAPTARSSLASILGGDVGSTLGISPTGSGTSSSGESPEIRIASSSAVRIQSLTSNSVSGGGSTTADSTTTNQPTTSLESTTGLPTTTRRTRTTTSQAPTTRDSRLTTGRSSTAWRTSAYPGTTTPTTLSTSTSSSGYPTTRGSSLGYTRRLTPWTRFPSTGSSIDDEPVSIASTFEREPPSGVSTASRFQSSSVQEVSQNVVIVQNNQSDNETLSRTTSSSTIAPSTTSPPTTTTTSSPPTTASPSTTTSTTTTTTTTSPPTTTPPSTTTSPTTTTTSMPPTTTTSSPPATTTSSPTTTTSQPTTSSPTSTSPTASSTTTTTTTARPPTTQVPRIDTSTVRPTETFHDLTTKLPDSVSSGSSRHDDDVRRRTTQPSTTTTKTTTPDDHEEIGNSTARHRDGTTGSADGDVPLERSRAGAIQRQGNESDASNVGVNVNYSIVDEPASSETIRVEYPSSRSMEDLQARHLRRFAVTFVLDATNMSVARWFRSIDTKFRTTLAQVLKGGDITQPFDSQTQHRFDKIDLAENSYGNGSGAVDDGLVTSYHVVPTSSSMTKGKTRQSEPMMAAVASRRDIAQDLDQSDVIYLDPTPIRAGKRFYVSVVVRNGKNSPDQFITARLAMEILQANTTPGILERRLETRLDELLSGVPNEVSTISEAGATRTEFENLLPMLLAIVAAVAIVLFIVLVTYCISNMKKRKARKEHWKHYQLGEGSRGDSNKQESNNRYPLDNAMELNCPRFMSSSSGGVHLANDEECTRGEEDESRSGNESVQTNQAATLSIESPVDVRRPSRDASRDFSSTPLPPHATVSSNASTMNINRNTTNNNKTSTFGTTSPLRVASTTPKAASTLTRPSTSNGGQRQAHPASMIAPSTSNTLNTTGNNRRPAHSVATVPAGNSQNYKDWPTPLVDPNPSTSTFAVENDGRYGSVGTFNTGGRTFGKENNTRL